MNLLKNGKVTKIIKTEKNLILVTLIRSLCRKKLEFVRFIGILNYDLEKIIFQKIFNFTPLEKNNSFYFC